MNERLITTSFFPNFLRKDTKCNSHYICQWVLYFDQTLQHKNAKTPYILVPPCVTQHFKWQKKNDNCHISRELFQTIFPYRYCQRKGNHNYSPLTRNTEILKSTLFLCNINGDMHQTCTCTMRGTGNSWAINIMGWNWH